MNICYNTRNLTLQEKKELCLKAKEKAYEWWVDSLDCSKSFRRQRTNVEFQDALDMMTKNDHFVVIWRIFDDESYLQISFSTMGKTPEYFLWINLDEKLVPEFTQNLERYNFQNYT